MRLICNSYVCRQMGKSTPTWRIYMKLCWIVVLVGISIILVFLYSLVAMSSRTERFIEQLMEEEGRKDTDEQDMEANITEGKERQEHE